MQRPVVQRSMNVDAKALINEEFRPLTAQLKREPLIVLLRDGRQFRPSHNRNLTVGRGHAHERWALAVVAGVRPV